MRHRTNFDTDERGEQFKAAARLCGLPIEIRDKAYDEDGKLLPTYKALWTAGGLGISYFWRKVEEVRNNA